MWETHGGEGCGGTKGGAGEGALRNGSEEANRHVR